MLSRSQAKGFFLWGTGLMTAVFLFLTYDSFQRIPGQTKEENLDEHVIRGKDLWDKSNCMGCHTLLGEGGYYAPELTKVYERRGPQFIFAMIKNPAAMYPGERKMQQYNFSDDEINDLVAFFKWIGGMDLNGFPPQPQLLRVAVPGGGDSVAVTQTQPKIFNQMCIACHAINGQGGAVGPALDTVGDRKNMDQLVEWISDPPKVKPGTLMPKLPLSNADVKELAAYLSQLKQSNKK